MKILWNFDRLKEKIRRWYRKEVFKEKIACPHSDFTIVGEITLINRNITLGHNVTIYPDVMFFGDGPIIIGNNVSIGNGTVIYASNTDGGVTIGNDTQIAAQCYIIDMDHGTRDDELIRNQSNSVSPVFIGTDVWLSAGCIVLKGSIIHDGAIIGASSLVKGEIPQKTIAIGIPAKAIKKRVAKK